MSFSSPIPPIEPSTTKYWLTELNTTSVKSPFSIRMSLVNKPNDEKKILKWMDKSYGKFGYKYKTPASMCYAEIFFKDDSAVTMFVLQWGDSLT